MHAGRCLRSGDRWRRSGRPWGIHLEVAHKLSEQTSWDRHKRRWEEVFEIFEVLVLAVAAIATAWTGYQAARVDGAQSVLYGRATRDLLGADAASTLDGQQPVADLAISNGWLQARGGGISGQYWTVSRRSWSRCGTWQLSTAFPDQAERNIHAQFRAYRATLRKAIRSGRLEALEGV
jgi:hypothetical protein